MNIYISLFFCKYKAEITVDSFTMLDIKIIYLSQVITFTQKTAVFTLHYCLPCRDQTGSQQLPRAVPGASTGSPWRPHLSWGQDLPSVPPQFRPHVPESQTTSLPQPDSPYKRLPFSHCQIMHHQGTRLSCVLSLLYYLPAQNFHTNSLDLHFLSSKHSFQKFLKNMAIFW